MERLCFRMRAAEERLATQAVSLEAADGEDLTSEADAPSPPPGQEDCSFIKAGVLPVGTQVHREAWEATCSTAAARVATCAVMTPLRSTGTAVYEIRRAQSRDEMAAALT